MCRFSQRLRINKSPNKSSAMNSDSDPAAPLRGWYQTPQGRLYLQPRDGNDDILLSVCTEYSRVWCDQMMAMMTATQQTKLRQTIASNSNQKKRNQQQQQHQSAVASAISLPDTTTLMQNSISSMMKECHELCATSGGGGGGGQGRCFCCCCGLCGRALSLLSTQFMVHSLLRRSGSTCSVTASLQPPSRQNSSISSSSSLERFINAGPGPRSGSGLYIIALQNMWTSSRSSWALLIMPLGGTSSLDKGNMTWAVPGSPPGRLPAA